MIVANVLSAPKSPPSLDFISIVFTYFARPLQQLLSFHIVPNMGGGGPPFQFRVSYFAFPNSGLGANANVSSLNCVLSTVGVSPLALLHFPKFLPFRFNKFQPLLLLQGEGGTDLPNSQQAAASNFKFRISRFALLPRTTAGSFFERRRIRRRAAIPQDSERLRHSSRGQNQTSPSPHHR